MIFSDDTIFAPASGVGRSALSVIRISGAQTRFVIETMCGNVPAPRRMSLRKIIHPENGQILDEALVVFFDQPKTFTGEDLAELHIHGSLAVRKAVLEALGSFSGCRVAEKGEFSKRAFLNGRMDLAQAEGLGDLIDSETEQQRQQALSHMTGVLGKYVAEWRSVLLESQALVESVLDFSDEEDVDEAIDTQVFENLQRLKETFQSCLSTRIGERIRDGFVVVLIGEPNSGKSSLLNALSQKEAAIVSSVPGTTRDTIEVPCDLDGYPVTFIDTAGLRDTQDVVEREGIKRTLQKVSEADIVLRLVPPEANARLDLLQTNAARTFRDDASILIVGSKCDLTGSSQNSEVYPETVLPQIDVFVSATTGKGLDELFNSIRMRIENFSDRSSVLLTRERHRHAVTQALHCVERAITLLQSFAPLELVAEDIRLTGRALGMITGDINVDDVLDQIFSSFCIGK